LLRGSSLPWPLTSWPLPPICMFAVFALLENNGSCWGAVLALGLFRLGPRPFSRLWSAADTPAHDKVLSHSRVLLTTGPCSRQGLVSRQGLAWGAKRVWCSPDVLLLTLYGALHTSIQESFHFLAAFFFNRHVPSDATILKLKIDCKACSYTFSGLIV
jgi:hypothetical protein